MLAIPSHRHFKVVQLVAIDEPTERFYDLANTLVQAIAQLDEHDWRRQELLRVLDHAMQQIAFVQHPSEQFYALVAGNETSLRAQVERMQADPYVPNVVGVEHSHIDLAWFQFYRITLNEHGQLLSIWDKRHKREALAAGQAGNVFEVFQDKPMVFDARDIDIYYHEKRTCSPT